MLLVIVFMLPEHYVLSETKCIFICCQCLFVAAGIMVCWAFCLHRSVSLFVFNFQQPPSCNHIPRKDRDGPALVASLEIFIARS